MSEQDLKHDQEAIEDSQPTELDEFKASMGDPSEVPEPTSTTAAAPGPSKDQGDKMPPKQGSSMKAPMPKEVSTKMGMINAMMKKMNGMNKDAVEMMYNMAKMPKDKMGETMQKMNAMMMPKEGMKPMMSMKKPKMGEETEYKVTAKDIDIKDDVKALFGNEDLSNPSCMHFSITALELAASDPPLKTHALPDFKHNAEASAVTFGRDS